MKVQKEQSNSFVGYTFFIDELSIKNDLAKAIAIDRKGVSFMAMKKKSAKKSVAKRPAKKVAKKVAKKAAKRPAKKVAKKVAAKKRK